MTTRWVYAILLVGVLVVGLAAWGRLGCSPAAVARLTEANGALTRDYAAAVGQWKPAASGSRFDYGDAVRTAANSTGALTFDDGALLRLAQLTIVRLSRTEGNGGKGIDVEQGEAVIESGAHSLQIQTEVGTARVEAGSVLRLARGKSGLRFLVTIGHAELAGSGSALPLLPGKGFEIGIGQAVLEEFTDPVASVAPRNAPAAGPSSVPPVSAAAVATPDAESSQVAVRVSGKGVSVMRSGDKRFSSLPAGDHVFAAGSQLRLAGGDSLHASKDGASVDVTQPGTYRVSGGSSLIEGGQGSFVVAAERTPLALPAAGAVVTVGGAGGRAVANVSIQSRTSADILALAGRVSVKLGDQERIVEPGQTLKILSGQLKLFGASLDYFDVQTEVGGSLIVHDPRPPSAVAFQFGELCEGVGIVEISRDKQTASGRHSVSLLLPTGTHAYRARCISPAGEMGAYIASGSIAVLRDAGVNALPAKAPSSFVDVDGRSYTLLYQNRLPQATVTWPGAPSAPGYTLTIKSGSTVSTRQTTTPSVTFASGSLREGPHEFRFQTSTGRQSRSSRVTIAFDNVAPKASIAAPANASFGAGEAVSVSGIALPGWSVFVQGEVLPQDEHQRFSGRAVAGTRGLVLRFSNKERGDHYYLRRIAGL